MEQFHYELMFDEQNHCEQNTLFAETLAVAIAYFDEVYLQLHLEGLQKPDSLILRNALDGEEIARYEMHCDVAGGPGFA